MKMNKKILSLLLLFFISNGCNYDKKKEQKIEFEKSKIEFLESEKNKIVTKIDELNEDLKKINSSIDKITNNQKVLLVTGIKIFSEPFKHKIEIQANINTRQNLILFPELSGKLEEIYVTESQQVKKGDLLAIIDDSGLNEELEQLKIQFSLSKTNFERTERLWNKKIGSEMKYLESKAKYESQKKMVDQMKKRLSKTKIISPFKGIIDEIKGKKGQILTPYVTPVLRIINLDKMYVEALVPENHLPNIKIGSEAIVNIPVLNLSQKTKISQTGNYINPNNRTFRIEAPLNNTNNIIKPNLAAKILITDYYNKKAIMIPTKIINENAEGQPYIFKLIKTDENSIYKTKKVFIEIGKSTNEKTEILNGIKVDDFIIDEGSMIVDDNQKVKNIN
ncbi:MAG: efflux transporter periplasmic adaptor subunit [Flavobacteriaceae bacterium]|nr:efflux transporter periplasmic adaptor subunit [Flavobacteriaceae bacterium]